MTCIRYNEKQQQVVAGKERVKGNSSMRVMLVWCCVSMTVLGGCAKEPASNELMRFPLDGVAGLLTRTGIEFDKDITSDQNGSLRITTTERKTVRLYETGDLNMEDARLVYQAKLRTRELQGKAYLEMECHFPDRGNYFSRALDTALSGSTPWTVQATPFVLKPGENPDNIKLNLVVDGSGVVWIDDMRLLKEPR